jgi:hypothetical protein
MANNITTFNTDPYYDDFDDGKNYHRILFRPGFAVQARELTQLQTILQDQISKFGQHVFKEGSRVLDGQIFIDDTAKSVKLNTLFGSNTLVASSTGNINTVDVSTFEGAYAYGVTTNIKEIVKKVEFISGIPYIFTQNIYRGNATGYNAFNFANNEVIRFVNPTTNVVIGFANTAVTDAVGEASLVHIDTGIFFVKGHFVKNAANTIVASASSRTPNVSIGFTYSESVVSSSTDNTLLDPAQGAYNYAAPGADRYKISLNLTKLDGRLNSNNLPTNYFELVTLQEGKARTPFNDPSYSKLMDTMAQRTYEESGNYDVIPFKVRVTNASANSSNAVLAISAGTSYINGYRVEYNTQTNLIIPKARDTDSVSGYDIGNYFGNYIKVTALANGTFNLANTSQVQLHRVSNRGALTNSTLVGNAHVSSFQYDSGSSNTAVFKLFLHNIKMKGNTQFGNVKSVILGTYNSVTAFANVASTGKYTNNSTKLYDTDYQSYIFPLAHPYVSAITSSEYEARRVFKSVTFTTGSATIVTDSGNERFVGATGGVVPTGLVATYYTVVTKTASGTFGKGKHIPLDTGSRTVTLPAVGSGSPGQATFNLNDGTFNGVCDIIATIDIENNSTAKPARKTKTLASTSQTYRNISSTKNLSLKRSDVYRINAVYWTGSNTAIPTSSTTGVQDITDRFSYDLGQRDTHYDHGTIKLRNGADAPRGFINVVFDYFTHSGKGYFDLSSYPIDYAKIPTYAATDGTKYSLTDSYDFRPRRVDSTANTTLQFDSSVQLPDYAASINSDYSYYLTRIDKLFITKNGDFLVKAGIPSFNAPVPPSHIADGMLIATMKLSPYTINESAIQISSENNRRYTMRDIGKLNDRLSRVEYYTSLSLLEKNAKDMTILDSVGNNTFKNGILVDNFSGHSVGDVLNPDYKVSIDMNVGIARPLYVANSVSFTVGNLSGTTKTGDLITRPYTESIFISQTLASNTENVNPFNVFVWKGNVKLSPDNDYWYDNEYAPVIQFNDDGAFDNWYTNQNFNSQFNSWQNGWFGSGDKSSASFANINVPNSRVTGALNLLGPKPGTQTYSGGLTNVVLSTALIPFMRPIKIKFDIKGAKPNTALHCFFGGTMVSPFITVGANSAAYPIFERLITNAQGEANGYINIPASTSTSAMQFLTGEKLVEFIDSPINISRAGITTHNSAIFSAQGIYQKVAKASIKKPVPVAVPPSQPPVTPVTPTPQCPSRGTVLASACISGTTTRQITKADGNCGTYFENEYLSTTCGAGPGPVDPCSTITCPTNVVESRSCSGTTMVTNWYNGQKLTSIHGGGCICGTYAVETPNHPDCAVNTCIPAGTIIGQGCEGRDYVTRTATGALVNGVCGETVTTLSNDTRCVSCSTAGTYRGAYCSGTSYVIEIYTDSSCNYSTQTIANDTRCIPDPPAPKDKALFVNSLSGYTLVNLKQDVARNALIGVNALSDDTFNAGVELVKSGYNQPGVKAGFDPLKASSALDVQIGADAGGFIWWMGVLVDQLKNGKTLEEAKTITFEEMKKCNDSIVEGTFDTAGAAKGSDTVLIGLNIDHLDLVVVEGKIVGTTERIDPFGITLNFNNIPSTVVY